MFNMFKVSGGVTFLLLTQNIVLRGFWIPETDRPDVRTDLKPDECLFGFDVEGDTVICRIIQEKCSLGFGRIL
jgi:hypothetical protein